MEENVTYFNLYTHKSMAFNSPERSMSVKFCHRYNTTHIQVPIPIPIPHTKALLCQRLTIFHFFTFFRLKESEIIAEAKYEGIR